MQQVGAAPDVWRRASTSPVPRPILKAPSATVSRRPRPARVRKPRGFSYLVLITVTTVASAVGVLAFAGSGRPASSFADSREAMLARIEQFVDLAGLGLQQVSVTGHRFTPDADIFDAVDLRHARTMLSFDSTAAQARIEQLPWVERASIDRVLPDGLEVRVTERVPFARWQDGARNLLIDKIGRTLAVVGADAGLSLPRVAGEGAAREAARLYAALEAYPALLRGIDVAERVGMRRWTLKLERGGGIHLPAEDETGALARAAQIVKAGLAPGTEIDLRVAGRIAVRERPDRKNKLGQAAETGAAAPRI